MNKKNFFLSLAFFISGISAILYEILWIRLLSLSFGGVTLVVGIVTGLFLIGLALGAFFGGKTADFLYKKGTRKVFVFYSLIEVLTALLGVLNLAVFRFISLNPGDWRWLIAITLVLIQTTIVGFTWPLMFKILLSLGESWKVAGKITFLNTIGGALGAFVSSFILISNFGILSTLVVAVGGNILAFFFVIFYQKGLGEGEIKKEKEKDFSRGIIINRTTSTLVLIALGLIGFLGMGMEIFWMRSFGLVLGSSIYSFSLVLTFILLGLALGGKIVEIFEDKFSLKVFVWVFYVWAFVILLGQALVTRLPFFVVWWNQNVGRTFLAYEIVSGLVVSAVVLVPSIISGIIFAQGIILFRGAFSEAAKKSGISYSVNTTGAVLGGFLTSIFLISLLGLKSGVTVFVSLSILFFLLLALFVRLSRPIILTIFTLILAGFGFIAFKSWDEQILSSGAWMYGHSVIQRNSGIKLLSYKDGREATVATTFQEGTTALLINGKADASNDIDMGTEAVLGHVPILLHQNPEKVLVIGLGSGITAGAISKHQKVKEITVAEIEPAVIEAARKYFSDENYNVLDNSKIKLVVNDARNYLLTTGDKFDVITSEPSNPWIAGHGNLFTKEYFEIAKRRLADDGVFFQWIHLYNLRPEELMSVITTFDSEFEYVQLWTSSNPVDIFLAGKVKTPFKLSWNRFEEALNVPGVRASLKRRGFDDEIRLFSLLWARDATIDKLAKGGEINSDFHPTLEYRAPFGLFEKTLKENFDILLNHFQEGGNIFDISGMPAEKLEEMKNARQSRFLGMQARQKAAEGKYNESFRLAQKGLEFDDDSPSLKRFVSQLYLKKASESQEKIDFLKKAIKSDEINYVAYTQLLDIYIQKKMFKEAQDLLEKGKETFPWSGTILMYEGILRANEKEYDKAEILIQKAVELESWNILIHNNLAHLYQLEGKMDLAKKQWEVSLSLEPNQPSIRSLLK